MRAGQDFFNPHNHDFIRAAVAVPGVRVADPAFNAQQVMTLMERRPDRQARFFRLSQLKRRCIPKAPKVGSGGSLSPRGDYRAPSDSEATVWLQ